MGITDCVLRSLYRTVFRSRLCHPPQLWELNEMRLEKILILNKMIAITLHYIITCSSIFITVKSPWIGRKSKGQGFGTANTESWLLHRHQILISTESPYPLFLSDGKRRTQYPLAPPKPNFMLPWCGPHTYTEHSTSLTSFTSPYSHSSLALDLPPVAKVLK